MSAMRYSMLFLQEGWELVGFYFFNIHNYKLAHVLLHRPPVRLVDVRGEHVSEGFFGKGRVDQACVVSFSVNVSDAGKCLRLSTCRCCKFVSLARGWCVLLRGAGLGLVETLWFASPCSLHLSFRCCNSISLASSAARNHLLLSSPSCMLSRTASPRCLFCVACCMTSMYLLRAIWSACVAASVVLQLLRWSPSAPRRGDGVGRRSCRVGRCRRSSATGAPCGYNVIALGLRS